MRCLFLLLTILVSFSASGNTLKGIVMDDHRQPLPYATVMIKGTTSGTTTNAAGHYQLELPAGDYVIVCQYMGFKKTEHKVTLSSAVQELDFQLEPISMQVKEVVVKAGGEDPAYAIIREAIKKRHVYQQQVKEFTCMAYTKGTLQSKQAPNRIFGQKVDKVDMGVDSAGKGVLFLTETVSKVGYRYPDKMKLEVISSRKSGGGMGFSFPAFISFYDNNVEAIATQLGPRGFISPIAENALNFYKYRLEGSFIEDGKNVYKITVIPKRKMEPLFSGSIFITDEDWRIHSTDLFLTPEYQLELMDTLEIRQTHVQVNRDVWRVKDQVIHIAFQKFGFKAVGNFVSVYSEYNLQPHLPDKYFDKVVMKLDSAFDKKPVTYWDSIRPVPLETYEAQDFHTRDSAAKANKDSAASRYRLDSLQRKQGPVKVMDVLWNNVKHNYYFHRDSAIVYNSFYMKSLVKALKYNTVEGLVLALEPSMVFNTGKNEALRVSPWVRYGLSNTHLNAGLGLGYTNEGRLFHKLGRNDFQLSGGKRVSQFNHDNPIDNITNEFYTLILRENYMKLYENWYARGSYTRTFQNNYRLTLSGTYENRIPLENTTDFSIFGSKNKLFLPNHPYELASVPFERHSAVVMEATFHFQPGQRFIELPDRRMPYGSKAPVFEISYAKGIPGIANSVVDFDKWKVGVEDAINLKLFGEFKYHVNLGGFLNSKDVELPDYQHFNGNQTFYTLKYLNSFQLAPYYLYSTTASFYTTANVEHHFNGLLTNKIPLFNRLKWNLVVGANAFYVNGDNNYLELFAGLENIFKIARVDVITGYQSKDNTRVGVRVGFGGILGSMFKPN